MFLSLSTVFPPEASNLVSEKSLKAIRRNSTLQAIDFLFCQSEKIARFSDSQHCDQKKDMIMNALCSASGIRTRVYLFLSLGFRGLGSAIFSDLFTSKIVCELNYGLRMHLQVMECCHQLTWSKELTSKG